MASEYFLKLAREQAPPEEKRELTPREKRQNWWHYHKWYVLAGVLAALMVFWIVWDIFIAREPVPDYQIACVGSGYLPPETVIALEEALMLMCEDLNQDGRVLVQVKEYPIFIEDLTYQTLVAAQVQLSTDLTNNESLIFLLEDPVAFQEQTGVLAYPDGTIPAEGETIGAEAYCRWTDCPVLADLELGEYTQQGSDGDIMADNQQLLSQFYVARRALSQENAVALAGAENLWQKLIAGANFEE